MKDIYILADTTKNFTPSDLMQRYTRQNPGAAFDRGPYGEALLILESISYKYHHWYIGDGFVLMTLEEVQQ